MDTSSSPSACGSWWRLPLLLGLVLAAILLARGRGVRESTGEPADGPTAGSRQPTTGETVSLAIQFSGGHEQRYEAIAWHEGMTVRDALNTPRRLNIKQQGSGASSLLTEIDRVANEGAGGRNWTYTVNGQHADRSFAVYELRPGDRVLWSFALQE